MSCFSCVVLYLFFPSFLSPLFCLIFYSFYWFLPALLCHSSLPYSLIQTLFLPSPYSVVFSLSLLLLSFSLLLFTDFSSLPYFLSSLFPRQYFPSPFLPSFLLPSLPPSFPPPLSLIFHHYKFFHSVSSFTSSLSPSFIPSFLSSFPFPSLLFFHSLPIPSLPHSSHPRLPLYTLPTSLHFVFQLKICVTEVVNCNTQGLGGTQVGHQSLLTRCDNFHEYPPTLQYIQY